MSVDGAFHAEPRSIDEVLDGRQCSRPLGSGPRNGPGNWMLRRMLERAHQAKYVVLVKPLGRDHFDQRHLSGRDCAGLIEHDRVHPAS